MDPVQKGGPWTWGPSFVLSRVWTVIPVLSLKFVSSKEQQRVPHKTTTCSFNSNVIQFIFNLCSQFTSEVQTFKSANNGA